MTDYGMRVKNTAGNILIDSTYVNYSLWEHGENVTTQNTGFGIYRATITFADAFSGIPLIAIKPSSVAHCGVDSLTKDNGNYTGFVVNSTYNTAITFDWMAFAPRTDESSEVYGLRIYNSSTDLVFDSGYAPMIISDVDTCSPAFNGTVNITHPSDTNAYFIRIPSGSWQTIGEWDGHTSKGRIYGPMMRYINATTLNFGGIQGAYGEIPVEINFSDGYWPDPWTILTIKKAFY